MQMEAELEKRRELSLQNEKKVKDFEAAKEESEAIIKMMQERVDHVNSQSAESAHLEEKIKELEEKVNEVPMMQREVSFCLINAQAKFFSVNLTFLCAHF